MKRAKSINALFTQIEEEFPPLEAEYNKCISNVNITGSLQIRIYDFLNHNRSILDYIAKEIDAYCLQKKSKGRRVYFPIAKKTETKTAFESNLQNSFPGLRDSEPDIYKYLIDIQHFNGNDWLPEFSYLVNENKHNELSPQTTAECGCVVPSLEGYTYNIAVGDRGFKSISVKEGGTICFQLPDGQKKYIRGPQEITKNTTRLDHADPGIVLEQVKWTDLKFVDIPNTSAIVVLRTIKQSVNRIYTDLEKIL